MRGLTIDHLSVATRNGQPILHDLSLQFNDDQLYALIGCNGCGKSTLVNTIAGSPDYIVTGGHIRLDGRDITTMTADQRAKLGIFLGLQYPAEITGVTYGDFLRTALTNLRGNNFNFFEVLENLQVNAQQLGFKDFDYHRDLNVGFSGGEKKKSEILQMLAIKPRFAFLDEPDSGLDKASIQKLADRLARLDYPTSLIVISHRDTLLNQLHPNVTYNLEDLQ